MPYKMCRKSKKFSALRARSRKNEKQVEYLWSPFHNRGEIGERGSLIGVIKIQKNF